MYAFQDDFNIIADICINTKIMHMSDINETWWQKKWSREAKGSR